MNYDKIHLRKMLNLIWRYGENVNAIFRKTEKKEAAF